MQFIKNPVATINRKLQYSGILKYNVIYNLYLRTLYTKPRNIDISTEHRKNSICQILRSANEIQNAIEFLNQIKLPHHPDRQKNWDSIKAFKQVVREYPKQVKVLDAGGELYSPFVKWLYLLGYRDLYVYNIDFERNYTHGSIKYKNRNIITTEFDDGSLDVITCFSVIEHDLPIRELLLEFNRIIHPDGIVIISTDYFPTKVATDGSKTEYGDSTQDWNIFNDEELKNILQIAEEVGFEKPDMRDFHANEKLVSWKNKKYTFAYLELRPQ